MAVKFFLALLLVALVKADLEYAPYEVVRTAEDYEERYYPNRKWVSTSLDAYAQSDVEGQLFNRLFLYIEGANAAATTIPMTAPVTTKIIPGVGPNCKQTFVMSFYIPEAFQADPPAPTNPAVFIEDRPEFYAFSRQFSGFANDQDWISNAAALMQSLVNNNETVVPDPWYTAGYDSPYVIINRRNEVWFKKQ